MRGEDKGPAGTDPQGRQDVPGTVPGGLCFYCKQPGAWYVSKFSHKETYYHKGCLGKISDPSRKPEGEATPQTELPPFYTLTELDLAHLAASDANEESRRLLGLVDDQERLILRKEEENGALEVERRALIARIKDLEAQLARPRAPEPSSVKGPESPPPTPPGVEVERLYYELLFQVGMKHPGETRHQTALRYLQNAEKSDGVATKSNLHPPQEGRP